MGILVDEMEFFRHSAEGQTAAGDAPFKGIHHALLVNGAAGQIPQTAEIARHRLQRAGVTVSSQRFTRCTDRRAK